jgi:23S rRNA (guanosine2251-2'-O)-methyltransferase
LSDRNDVGGEQVEGRHAVRELLAAGRRRVHRLSIARGRERSPLLDEISELASRRGISVRTVDLARLASEARTDAPQGVIARADPVPAADLGGLLARRDAFLVALDGVTDPGNLGAVLRVAETAGVDGVLLPRHRSARLTPAAVKAAAGAVEHVPIALVSGIGGVLERAARAGVWSVGLAADAPSPVYAVEVVDRPLMLVLGAEGRGLSRLVRERCDVVAHVPMYGRLESLNVATAAAVAAFDVARRRHE